MFLYLIEIFFVFLIASLIISQIIIPSFTNLSYFWCFRKKYKDINKKRDKLNALNLDKEIVKLEDEIQKTKTDLYNL